MLPVHAVADRTGIRHVVQTNLPQRLSGAVVVSGEPAIQGSGEDQPASGGQDAAALRGALALGPDGLFRFEIDGLDAAVTAVTVRPRTHVYADAGGKEAAGACRNGIQIHAGFD